MRALVTGGTGFIGRHLVRSLWEAGYEIRCLVRNRARAQILKALPVEIVSATIDRSTNWRSILEDVDIVYHLAGVTRARTPAEYYEGNHEVTSILVDACLRYGPHLQRFVHVSSLAAAGPSLDGHPLQEDSPCRPVSHYGRSKLMSEQAVLKAGDRLPISIVRPSAVYGPGDRDFFMYIRLVESGILPLIGFRTKLLNLVFVEDVVRGIFLAGSSPAAVGHTFFLGSDRDYSTLEIGNAVAQALGRQPARVRVPHAMVLAIGALAEGFGKASGRQVFFNMQKAREAIQSAWACSIAKACALIGFNPQVSLIEGIQRTCAWYRMEGRLPHTHPHRDENSFKTLFDLP